MTSAYILIHVIFFRTCSSCQQIEVLTWLFPERNLLQAKCLGIPSYAAIMTSIKFSSFALIYDDSCNKSMTAKSGVRQIWNTLFISYACKVLKKVFTHPTLGLYHIHKL